MNLTCFTDLNLFSKKEFIFHDSHVEKYIPLLLLLNGIFLSDMYKRSLKLNNFQICKNVISSFYISDFVTALYHSYIIDKDIFKLNNTYICHEDRKIIVETNFGYGSAHHIFPSNWKDVGDHIAIRDHFIIILPFFLLNLLNIDDDTAYMNYMILYYQSMNYISHKYAHERNHDRPVPEVIRILQDLGIFLNGRRHSLHHTHLNMNFATLSGISDIFANKVIDNIDRLFKIVPNGEIINECIKYEELYGLNIKIRFTGDIEGEIEVLRHDNVLTYIP
jgi:hypothetical protein